MAEAYVLNFASTADSAKVSETSRSIIRSVMKEAGVFSVTVTSTARSIYDQARVMYENIESTSVSDQKRLYASAGDKVIDVYEKAKADGKDRNATIALMKAKIVNLGGSTVSRHCADTDNLNVVDIGPSSIKKEKRSAFEAAVKKESRISKYIFPPTDPAYHLEIPQ